VRLERGDQVLIAAIITVTRSMQGLRSHETYIGNQSEAVVSFDSWGFAHKAVVGLEFGRQTSAPTFFKYAGVPTTNLFAPDPDQPFTATTAVLRTVSVEALTQAAYMIDTVHLADDWELTAAARLDRFDASVQRTAPTFSGEHVDLVPTWRAALTYKPVANASVYFASGTSFDPSAEGLSLSASNTGLPAERSSTYELGGKAQFGGLLLSGALFRTTLYNVREAEPGNPTVLTLAGTARVDGFEVILQGDPIERWHLFGGYTFLQTAIIASPNGDLGSRLQNAPKHAVKLWTLYDLTPELAVGGGGQYVGNRAVQSGPDPNGFLQIVPGYWTADLMMRYRVNQWVSVQVNLKNLNNAYGYDGIDNNHVVPLAGRSALFTIVSQF
jgi:catecholate siderophore receptor